MYTKGQYSLEQFAYFINSLECLYFLKGEKELYWNTYKKLQDWLQSEGLGSDFIKEVEKQLNRLLD
ncbi:hypothetical protein V7166_20460 [Bacillus thuringiensis]